MKRLMMIISFLLASPALAVQPGLGFGENERLDTLFAQMQSVEGAEAASAEREAIRIFRQSGSAAMDLLLDRGLKALEAEDYPMAVWHFSALIDHAPDFAEAHNARASAFFLMGKYGEAMVDIEVALALNPRHFGALGGLGVIQEQLEHPENALRAYKAALALNPHSADFIEAVKRVEDQLFMVH